MAALVLPRINSLIMTRRTKAFRQSRRALGLRNQATTSLIAQGSQTTISTSRSRRSKERYPCMKMHVLHPPPWTVAPRLTVPQAAAIRRKLQSLIDRKVHVPGTNKPFNKTSLSKELQAIAERSHPVKTYQHNVSSGGPSPQALARFLKKSGGMGGGDSEAYYFGNMLLEKLRIWNGEKKTKAREKAEVE